MEWQFCKVCGKVVDEYEKECYWCGSAKDEENKEKKYDKNQLKFDFEGVYYD